jgi:type 1 glutamine amidotransferase
MASRRAAVFQMVIIVMVAFWSAPSRADPGATDKARPKRLLLLGQKPDSHPRTTHEYMAGTRIIARLLQGRQNLQVIVVQADNPWHNASELLDGADAVLLYLTEGAKWLSEDPDRLAAFQRLAKRGGGLSCIHWGMGTRESPPVQDFVQLFGACHGGSDRKYKVGDFQITPGSKSHPISLGIAPFDTHDELYYDLKFPKKLDGHTTLLETQISDAVHTIAWAWERPDGGRSFGFTGLHFHENWKRPEYRRLVSQGVLWTLNETIPADGLNVDLTDSDFALPDDPAK